MEESKRNVLRKLRLPIANNIDVKKVTEILYSRRVLDQSDRELVLAETTTVDKGCKLLDILCRKEPEAFGEFSQALRICGHNYLVNKIQSELTGKPNFLIDQSSIILLIYFRTSFRAIAREAAASFRGRFFVSREREAACEMEFTPVLSLYF